MLILAKSLAAWGTPHFDAVLKDELAQHAAELPLQEALAHSSTVADTPVTVLIHRALHTGSAIRVTAGIFYEGLLGGCACANDPTPESPYTEYCEVEVEIDEASGAATVKLLTE
jgi:hypothetical protein